MAALLMWVRKRDFFGDLGACLPLAKAARGWDVIAAKGSWVEGGL